MAAARGLAMPAFFGVEARPGRRTPYVPPPEEMRLHLTGATLGADPRKGERVVLKVRVSEGGREVFVCSFRGGGQEHCPLDLVLDEYAEFSIEGACSVHLVGYYMPEFGPEGEGGSRVRVVDFYSQCKQVFRLLKVVVHIVFAPQLRKLLGCGFSIAKVV